MKKEFRAPEIELIRFEAIDVIATSGDIDYVPGEDETPWVPAG